MKKAEQFTENDTTKELYKSSLFKGLWKNRKAVLDGFPGVHKGLAFPEPCLTLGGSNYTFKTSEVVDKVACKHGDKDFVARYKKDSKKFDVSLRQNLGRGLTGLLKYEERGEAQPGYVVGLDWKCGAFMVGNTKFNAQTGTVKYSTLFDATDYLKGLTLAFEGKGPLADLPALKIPSYNLGGAYDHSLGTSVFALNNKGHLTLSHHYQVDKSLSVAAEVVQPLKDGPGPKNGFTAGVTYQLDSDHQLKARVNKNGQLNVAIKKDVSPQLNFIAAAVVDLAAPEKMMCCPALGFKVVAKC